MFDFESQGVVPVCEESSMARVNVIDEATSGEKTNAMTLDFLTEEVTVREVIRSRVYQEVTEHNARQAIGRPPLVSLTRSERDLNGVKTGSGKRLDWEQQFETAIQAFEGNGFLLFAGGRQLLDLDEKIELRHDTDVTFLRLVPLVGG